MPVDFKKMNNYEKMELAQKHLSKFAGEIKRHFDFSDFQIIQLFENTSKNFRETRKNDIKNFFKNFLKIK